MEEKIMTNKTTQYVGISVVGKSARCNCGNADCPQLVKGELAHKFVVKGTTKYIRLECFNSNKFVEQNDFSEYDALTTIEHDVVITTSNKAEAFIKFLQGFKITVGFGKNKGKFYCKAFDNKTCYSTGHFIENGEDLEVKVNGQVVHSLEEFRAIVKR